MRVGTFAALIALGLGIGCPRPKGDTAATGDTAGGDTGPPWDTYAETLPDGTFAEIDLTDMTLVTETLVVQDLGVLSGFTRIDVLTGSSVLTGTAGWAANDSDAFAFTVAEPANVRMRAGWPDAAADLDFGIWYEDPDLGAVDLFSSFGDTYCLTGADPEECESAVPLEPGVPYYLLALGYTGTDEQAYQVELEWIAPS